MGCIGTTSGNQFNPVDSNHGEAFGETRQTLLDGFKEKEIENELAKS